MSATLAFDETNHTYTLGERRLPSVTSILKGAGLIDNSHWSDEAAWRGTCVHKALEYDDQGDLDETALDSSIQLYLEGWRRFRREFPCTVKKAELRMHHPILMYAGTLDRVVEVGGIPAIIEIKTGQPHSWHHLQTAAYAGLYEPSAARFAVYLRPDATYQMVQHKDRRDWEVWKGALTVYGWKKAKEKL